MSYDIWAECPTCGETIVDWNYTSNCGPMWREAGCDLADFHDKPASECLPILDAGIRNLEADPDRFRAMNPENGWGSYETLLPTLRELRDGLAKTPSAVVKIWR